MMIIGVDYHPSFQTIAFLMEETGECGEHATDSIRQGTPPVANRPRNRREKFYDHLRGRTTLFSFAFNRLHY
jgi:hypothetical protein